MGAMTCWSLDYGYMVDGGDVYTRKELQDLNIPEGKVKVTVIVSEDRRTGGVRAHMVSAKGNSDPWVAKRIKDDLEEFGYGGVPVVLKTDQELRC